LKISRHPSCIDPNEESAESGSEPINDDNTNNINSNNDKSDDNNKYIKDDNDNECSYYQHSDDDDTDDPENVLNEKVNCYITKYIVQRLQWH
jgi:hypothetical protein